MKGKKSANSHTPKKFRSPLPILDTASEGLGDLIFVGPELVANGDIDQKLFEELCFLKRDMDAQLKAHNEAIAQEWR